MRIANSAKLEQNVGAYNQSMHQLTDFLNDILSWQLVAKQRRAHRKIKVKRRFRCTRFISYRNIRQSAFDVLDLDAAPHKPVVIHITGSNGKGTAGLMLQSILRSLGYSVALYNKPHLVFPTERLLIDGWPIAPNEYLKSIKETIKAFKHYYPAQELGYLPLLFLAATHLVFTKYRVDFYLVEAGVGLKNDYTNIFKRYPYYYTIITDIDLMHRKRLGSTLQQIFDNKNANHRFARKTYLLFDPVYKGITVPSNPRIVQVKPGELVGVFNPYNIALKNDIFGYLGISSDFKTGSGSAARDSESKRTTEGRVFSELAFIPIGLFSKQYLAYFSQLLKVSVNILEDLVQVSKISDKSSHLIVQPVTSRPGRLSDTYARNSIVVFRVDTYSDVLKTIGVPSNNIPRDSILKTRLMHIKVGSPPLSSYAFIPFLPGRFTPIGVNKKNMVVVDNAHSLAQYKALAEMLKQLKAKYPIKIRVVTAAGKHSYRRKIRSIFAKVDDLVDLGVFRWKNMLEIKQSKEYRYGYNHKESELTEFDKKILQVLGIDSDESGDVERLQKGHTDKYTVTVVTGSVYFVGYVIELLMLRRGISGFVPYGFGTGNAYSWIALYRTQNWITKIKQFLRFLSKSKRSEFLKQISTAKKLKSQRRPANESFHIKVKYLAQLYEEYINGVTDFYIDLFKLLEVRQIGAFLPFKNELPIDLILRRVIKNVSTLDRVVIPVFVHDVEKVYNHNYGLIISDSPSVLNEEIGWRLMSIAPSDYLFLSDVLRGKKVFKDLNKLELWLSGSYTLPRNTNNHNGSLTMDIYKALGSKVFEFVNPEYYSEFMKNFYYLEFNKSSDVIFVPGVVFDLMGGRIGAGSGVYDRYLRDLNYTFVDLLTANLEVDSFIRSDIKDGCSQFKIMNSKDAFALRLSRYIDSLQRAIDILTTLDAEALTFKIIKLRNAVVLPVKYPFEQVFWLPGRYSGR